MKPTVCAVIPTRNRKEKTLRFLESFSKQTYTDLHIVIVDANSTDGTQDEVLKRYPKIDLINVDDESYWTASTNRGVEFALEKKYDYILTINDDSYINDDYVASLINVALKYDTMILGSRIDYMLQPDLVWSIGSYSNWGTRHIFQLSYNLEWFDKLPKGFREKELIEVEALPGNGVLIKRQVFEKIGLYNEFFLAHYHSDSEFIMRAVQNNIQAYCSNHVVVYNDCDIDSKGVEIRLTSLQSIIKTYFKKKSYLFFLPILYIVLRYCPFGKKLSTIIYFFSTPILLPIKEKLRLRSRFETIRMKVFKLTLLFLNFLRNLKFN